MNLNELWTWILETTAAIIIPVWNDLIQYLPLLLVFAIFGVVGFVAYMWFANSSRNASRVPQPIPAGRMPEDMHLPGPSLWPFVAPVGLVIILFAVVLGALQLLLSTVAVEQPEESSTAAGESTTAAVAAAPLPTPVPAPTGLEVKAVATPEVSLWIVLVFGVGLVVTLIGIIGWYRDASREYVSVEAGGHGTPDEMGSIPGWSLAPPEGMHLPGPSAWPLLAPVGLLFLVSGLIFGPAMFVGGLIMSLIAVIGWLLDARDELDDVEEHGHPTQADRNPEKAWPSRLIPVYFIVGAIAVGLTLLPWLISLLPGSSA